MNKVIKVAILSGLNYPVPPIRGGGPQIVLYNTALKMNDPEIEWTIFGNWEMGLESVDYDRNRIKALKTQSIDKFLRGLVDLLPYRWRKSLFSVVGNPDLMILNIKIARRLLFQKFDLVICHESYSLAYLIHKLRPEQKILTYVHNSKVHLDFDDENWRKYAHASTAGMILGSQIAKGEIQERFEILPKMSVIYNGIDTSKFNIERRKDNLSETRHRLGLAQADFVFIYCGRLSPLKQVHLILEAFIQLALERHDVSLLIVGSAKADEYGDDNYETDLKSMPPDNLAEKVKFVGFVQQEELPKFYGISNCAVLGTSKKKHQETLPLFLLEALSSGIPVIAPANGAIPEVIRQDKEGIILNAEYEMREMLVAMRRMVEEREIWAARAADISDTIRRDFSWERVADEVIDIIKQTVGEV